MGKAAIHWADEIQWMDGGMVHMLKKIILLRDTFIIGLVTPRYGILCNVVKWEILFYKL